VVFGKQTATLWKYVPQSIPFKNYFSNARAMSTFHVFTGISARKSRAVASLSRIVRYTHAAIRSMARCLEWWF
jgi:hypothetical protein